jgi:thymidine kinase
MEQENYKENSRKGWIEVISGSMFSGKTEELIRRLRRARIAKQKVEIYKPSLDKRYHEKNIVSHDSRELQGVPVESSQQILLHAGGTEVIGIDEAQFFDDGLADVCEALANKGIRVIVAGLDMDYLGKPFGPVPQLLAVAEYVTKVHAICIRCGNLAHYSFRTADSPSRILLGEQESYLPLCRSCFNEEMEKK